MSATLKDIARETGLSVATISKYVNGAVLKERNRILVEEAIEKLGYTANEYARGLKSNKSRTIGVVIPELANLFISTIITHVEEVLRHHGYSILICDCHSQEQLEIETMEFLNRKMVDGIINMPVCSDGRHLQAALNKGIPIVLVDRMVPNLVDCTNTVLIDNEKAAFDATTHLLECGHRNIGIIAGNGNVFTTKRRLVGYKAALAAYGIPVNENLIAYGDYGVEGGYSAVQALQMINPDMTALFVTNYEMTLGAVIATGERGIKLPDELSLIGFDNLDLARISHPRLTIVVQPLQEYGAQIANLMLSKLQNEASSESVHTMLQAKIVHGNSVRDLRNS